jgi:hypothetical protein
VVWAQAALEYGKNIRQADGDKTTGHQKLKHPPQDVKICVAGITYTEKDKYRSRVVMEYVPSLSRSQHAHSQMGAR